jgi:hypothetical protein
MKDLGYANSWIETPEEIVKCKEGYNKGEVHSGYRKEIGRCLHECGCIECGYTYLVDSSD